MDEKRAFPRAECNEIIKYANGKKAHAKDISLSGIRFCSSESIRSGSFLTLNFSLLNKGLIRTTGQIIWQRNIDSITFENGFKFHSMDQVGELLLSKYINQKLNTSDERRNSQRYLVDVNVNYALNAKAKTKNITTNGMSIFTKDPLTEKQILLLSILLPAGDMISMHGKTIWNKQLSGDLYENGIEFWNIGATEKQKLIMLLENG